jgi:intracellular multiplication protein IcmE
MSNKDSNKDIVPDDNLDEFASDFDTGSEFAEFDTKPSGGSLSDMLQNPVVKIALIAAGLIVIVGGIMLFSGDTVEQPDSVVAAGSDVNQTPGTEELSPAMRQAMEEYNQQQLDKAVQEGTSVLPTPIDPPKELLTPAEQTPTEEDPLVRWRQMQAEREQTQAVDAQALAVEEERKRQEQAQRQAAIDALSSSMSSALSSVFSDTKVNSLSYMQVTDMQAIQEQLRQEELMAQQQMGLQGSSNPNMMLNANMMIDPNTGAPVPTTPPKILISAGTIEYAQLINEANSDVPGPIVALLASGPFSGSKLLGSFTRQNEYLTLQFTTLVDKKGLSIPIQATALDPATTLAGMATDIDRRYWERVILPAAAEFIQGLGQAYAQQESQTVVVSSGTTVSSTQDLDFKKELAKGIESAADQVGEVLDEEGNQTEILVRVQAGTPMGILFMTAITDQDRIASRNNPMTARTLAEQQAQQNALTGGLGLDGTSGFSPESLQQMLMLQGLQSMNQGGTGTQNGQAGSPAANP